MIVKIRDFIYEGINLLISLVRILILSRFTIHLPKNEATTDSSCVILANGPSLKQSLQNDLNFMLKHKILAVNNFVYSDYYEQLKPSYYVLNAPEYFMEKGPTPLHAEIREKVYSGLVSRTTWPIFIFVPTVAAETNFWKKRLAQNKNISIVYYNSTPVEGWFTIVKHLFKWNLGMARPHNVLIPSIFVALNMGFKKLYVFGADHSWHEELKVSDDNRMVVNHEHFYDQSQQVYAMYKLDGQEYKIHDAFRKLYLAFKGYYVIREYASDLNAEIYNASAKSYIDAFARIKV